MYQVLARKWRPQSLEELIGQQHVARTLRNAIGGGRIAHAYLFAGVRGTGKTTVARIVAKCLNCEKGPTPTPCGVCTPCVEIAEGRAMDVLELDAASRTGVGDIRELQEVVSYAPVRDRYRVLIIDEVHMLSKSAFNALLKTLEEPPPRVVFVLATTELHKVLPTVLSRCQLFEFRRVTTREIAGHLRKICDAEEVKVSDKTLDRVARAGEGSVRDALSVLERVLAFCGRDVKDDEALAILGAVRADLLERIVAAMAARDAAALLEAFDAAAHEGHDLIHLWSEIVSVVRDLLLMRTLTSTSDLIARAPDEATALATAAGDLTREDLTRILQMLADLELGLKMSGQPQFLFEACLLRIAALGSVRPIEEMIARFDVAGGAPPPVPRSSPRPSPPPPSSARDVKKKELTPPTEPAAASPSGAGDVAGLIAALHAERPMLAVMLEGAAMISFESDRLVVAVRPDAEPVRRMLEREDTQASLKIIATRILGIGAIEIRIGAEQASPAHSALAKSGGTSAPAMAPSAVHGSREEIYEQARRDPGIKRLLSEFGAQIVDVRPLDTPPPSDGTGPELGAEEAG